MDRPNPFGRRVADKEHSDRVINTTQWVKGGIVISLGTLITLLSMAFALGGNVQAVKDKVDSLTSRVERIETFLDRHHSLEHKTVIR